MLHLTPIIGHYLTKVIFLYELFYKISEYNVEIGKVSRHAEYQWTAVQEVTGGCTGQIYYDT